jgi:hypothetical protein
LLKNQNATSAHQDFPKWRGLFFQGETNERGHLRQPVTLDKRERNSLFTQMCQQALRPVARHWRLVEKITAHGFLHILAHGLPSVALREDVFRQAFGAIAAVLFLRHFKHQFFHGVKLRRLFSDRKRGLVGVEV